MTNPWTGFHIAANTAQQQGGGGFLSGLSGMLPGIGTGLGVLGGLAGISGNRKAQKQQKAFLERALKEYENARSENTAFQAMGRSEAQRGLQDVSRGMDRAMQSASGAQSEALRSIGDVAASGAARGQRAAWQRGMANTTAGANMANQGRYQAMRAAGGVADRIASIRSGLHTQKGQALASQRNRLAQGYTNQGAQGMKDAQGLVNLLGSVDVQGSSPGMMGGIGQLIALLNKGK